MHACIYVCMCECKSYRLIVPFTTRPTFTARLFSVAAPRPWNNLPNSLKKVHQLNNLKRVLRPSYLIMLLITKI